MGRPIKSLQIGYDPTVQQQKSWAVQISKLQSGGQTTERRIHILPFRRRERAMLRFRRMHSLQKFASIHASFHNLFNSQRSLSKRSTFKLKRDAALTRVALLTDLIERAVNRLLMLGLVCLTAPPPHPHHSCSWYFWRYSCARSGIYNSVLRLMPHITSHISDNFR